MEIIKPSIKALNKAITFINKGGIVICPTDTVYGFLADALNKKAVEKIYRIKKRPRSKPLPVFVRDLTMAKKIAEINKKQEKIVKKYWPGKYTFVLKSKIKNKKLKIYGVAKNTIALRVPKYKFLNDLLKKINKPLVQTSVNLSNQPSLAKIDDIKALIGTSDVPILVVNGGNLKKSKPSKIIDLTSERLTRLR